MQLPDPRLGWARAGLAHRAMAVAALPMLLGQVALAVSVSITPAVPGNSAGRSGSALLRLMLVSFLVAPSLYYAAARIVRPHLLPGGEKGGREGAARHVLASAGAALAVPVVTSIAVASSAASANADDVLPVVVLFGLPALLLAVVTGVWGLVTASMRG